MEQHDKRAANFTSEETYQLISLVEKYKEILECKKSDATTWKQKEHVWKKVEEKFNASCANGKRSAKVLKEKYRNLKKKTKEKFAKNKLELTKIGGGQYNPPIITEVEEAIKAIVGEPQISGLENSYDCDAKCEFSVEEFRKGCGPSQQEKIVENRDEIIVENLEESENGAYDATNSKENKSKWCSYAPKDLKKPVTKSLRNTPKGLTEETVNRKVSKKFVSANTQLINEKLEFVRLQREKFLEEHKLKIEILELRKLLLQKQLGGNGLHLEDEEDF